LPIFTPPSFDPNDNHFIIACRASEIAFWELRSIQSGMELMLYSSTGVIQSLFDQTVIEWSFSCNCRG